MAWKLRLRPSLAVFAKKQSELFFAKHLTPFFDVPESTMHPRLHISSSLPSECLQQAVYEGDSPWIDVRALPSCADKHPVIEPGEFWQWRDVMGQVADIEGARRSRQMFPRTKDDLLKSGITHIRWLEDDVTYERRAASSFAHAFCDLFMATTAVGLIVLFAHPSLSGWLSDLLIAWIGATATR